MQPKRVVIVGAGFGGAYCAQALERARHPEPVETILIDRHNYFVFYPLLVEAGTGSLEPRHVVVPIRSFLKSGTFLMAEVTAVDFARQKLSYRSSVTGESKTVSYDHLVLSPGSVTRFPDVPGLREHGREMKSLGDAVALRDRAVSLLEAANEESDRARQRALLHFVVVGSNFTGAELAGEYDMFLKKATKRYPNLSPRDCQVSLIEIADRILPALEKDLAEHAQRYLDRRGVQILLNTSVREIHETEVVLNDGEVLPASTVVWCAGIAPPPLLKKLELPRDERGYVLCERDLRVQGLENVWAIGDAAVNLDKEGNAYPATAQHAVRQGTHAARNVARVLGGNTPEAFDYKPLGSLVALGCRSGVAKVFGVKLAGFAAWWMFRAVYLMKVPGLSRKARVALDWTFDLLFPPDVVQLGVHRRSQPGDGGPP
jgi:NADH dehydrogenase